MSNDLEGDDIWGDESKQPEDAEDDETRHMTVAELRQRIHLLNNDIRVMKSDVQRITHESRGQRERIRENQEKVKLNKQLPYLVANVVEVLEPDAEDGEFQKHLLRTDSPWHCLCCSLRILCFPISLVIYFALSAHPLLNPFSIIHQQASNKMSKNLATPPM